MDGWNLIRASLRFANFQLHLPQVGGLGRIHSCLQVGLLYKVAPAGMTIFRALPGFEMLHPDLGIVLALDHQHHSPGLVGPDVVANDGVGSLGFFACQKFPRARAW